jgi:hypothetical protein
VIHAPIHARQRDAAAWPRVEISATGKWVTREHPKIDRIACPWLIKRFIDPSAEFIYVPASQVIAVAEQTDAIPYDIDGVEFTHQDERCSYDAILRVYDIKDPALDHFGHDRTRRGYIPARSRSGMRRPVRDI